MMEIRQIILEPIVTEKSTTARETQNRYSFKVQPKSSKDQIAKAVEEIFNVHVIKVNTMNMRGKMKRLGRNRGRKSAWKKAVVTIAQGESVDFFEGA